MRAGEGAQPASRSQTLDFDQVKGSRTPFQNSNSRSVMFNDIEERLQLLPDRRSSQSSKSMHNYQEVNKIVPKRFVMCQNPPTIRCEYTFTLYSFAQSQADAFFGKNHASDLDIENPSRKVHIYHISLQDQIHRNSTPQQLLNHIEVNHQNYMSNIYTSNNRTELMAELTNELTKLLNLHYENQEQH